MKRAAASDSAPPLREAAGRFAALDARVLSWLARPGALLGLVAALYLAQISPLWYATPDSAAYLSIARSLANGNGLLAFGSLQIGYPPGYPLLAAPAFLVDGAPFLQLALLAAALAALLAWGVYRWAHELCGDETALLCALAMVHVSLWEIYRRALSELAFTAALLWSALLLTRLLRGPWPPARRALPAALLVTFTCLIRESGVALLPGFALAALAAARQQGIAARRALRLAAVVGAPAALAVAAFTLREIILVGREADPMGTHWGGFAQTDLAGAARLLEGVRLRIAATGQLLLPGMFKADGQPQVWLDANMALYLPLFALLGLGWWRLVRARRDVFALTFPFYFALYVVWPFPAGTRYLLPMWPLLLLCLWLLLDKRAALRRVLFAALLVAHGAVALGHWTLRDLPRTWRCNAQWEALAALAASAQPHATLGASAGASDCAGLIVSFLTDKRLHDAAQKPGELIALATEKTPPGYGQTRRHGPYVLLSRLAPP